MAKFTPRLSAPSSSDKNWIKSTKGGYNYCIEISNGSCLPNCVGYAWGRWREILGAYHNLSRNNAEVWWINKDGYERGQTPRVGAVMCWSKGQVGVGSDGAGHVCIVEKVLEDGKTVVTSESSYGGTRWYNKTRYYPYSLGGTYKFQGFIYLPIKFDDNTPDPKPLPTKSIEVVAKEVLNGLWGNGTARKQSLEAAGYNYSQVQQKVNELLSGASSQPTTLKSVDEIAQEVINGKWGNSTARKQALEAAGYNYAQVQQRVNEILAGSKPSGPKFAIGQPVKIVKKGNSRSDGKGNSSYGIGWTRYILEYKAGEKFAYRIGNAKGVTTGWYAEDGLAKI